MTEGSLAALLGLFRIINLRALRKHLVRGTLAAFALGGGVAVVVAVLLEVTSVSKAVEDVGYQIAGPAPLRVGGAQSRGGISPAVLDDIRHTEGVSEVVPIIRGVTLIHNHQDNIYALGLGVDCSAQWIIDPRVCKSGQKEPPPAISTKLHQRLDNDSQFVTDIGQLKLDTFQPVDDLKKINKGLVTVLPLSMAKAQYSRGTAVDMAYITLTKDADVTTVKHKLIDTLGPAFSVKTRHEPEPTYNVNNILLPLLGIFALVSIGVGITQITQITRLSVEERRRQIAVASALGASPTAITASFLSEAALLGFVGSLLGVATGIIIAKPIVSSASALTERYVGVTVVLILKISIILAGITAGVLLAIIAAIGPAISASKTPIAAELSGRAAHEQASTHNIWLRTIILLLIGLIGMILTWLTTSSGALDLWQAQIANVSTVIAMISLLMASAYLAAQAIASIRISIDHKHVTTLIIALNALRSDRSRTAAIAGAIAVPVVIVILLSGFLSAINIGATKVATSQSNSRIAITTTQYADYGQIDARFSPETVTKISHIPGVDKIERLTEIEIRLADGSLAHIQAQDRPTFPFGLLAGQDPKTSMESNQLVIGSVLARDEKLHVGDTLILGSGINSQAMRVGTIVATPEYGGRHMYLPYRTAEQIYGPQPAGLVFATPASGTTTSQIIDTIRHTSFPQPVTAVDTHGYANDIAQSITHYLNPLKTLKYGLLVIAFISVLATLLLIEIRRRREIALLQALGATRWRVFSITTVEAVIAGAGGGIFGALLTVAISEVVRRAAIVNVGLITPLIFPWTDAILYATLATLAAVIAAIIPAWQSTQAAPALALRDE